jgi:hypothetical protein
LNDPQFVEAARHLAEIALTHQEGREDGALNEMALRLLLRPLNSSEQIVVKRTLAEMRSFYEAQPEAAKRLLAIGESKSCEEISAPQLAAMTLVANQLLNLDEVLNK